MVGSISLGPVDSPGSRGAGIVLHVPHSSREIPGDVRADILLSDSELEAELARMTDWYTDELFAYPGAKVVRFPVSRLVVDPERFEDDSREPMARVGMGVIYTATSVGGRLRRAVGAGQRAALLEQFYVPHHRRLAAAVEEALEAHGSCVVVDCHSFPSVASPYEGDASLDRPDLCIGTDAFHTPAGLVTAVAEKAGALGWSVAVDSPFAGALVPMRFYGREKAVRAVMLEVNRGLYMDEGAGGKGGGFGEVREGVVGLISGILGWLGSARDPSPM